MKVLYQWAQENSQGWKEIDSKDWHKLPKLPVPQGLAGQNNQPGLLCNVSVQGITAEGYDHVAIEPITIGLDEGIKYTLWNDDPEDWPVGQRVAIVWIILPLAPDPKHGMAINTRQSCTRYLEGEKYTFFENDPPLNTTIRPYSDFIPPSDSVTRHGTWLSEQKFQEHISKAPQSEYGWRHWNEHLPDNECEINIKGQRVLKEQRSQSRYHQAEHTITYYQRNTDRATFGSYTNEDSLETTPGSSETETVTTDSSRINGWIFTTPTNEPNNADWPNGTYRAQWNCTAASAGVVYGCGFGSPASSTTGFNRNPSDLSSIIDSVSPSDGNGDGNDFSGTGLKLSSVSWDPAAGSAGDRYAVSLTALGDSHGDAITIQFNSDSYADGPWATASAALTGTITNDSETDIVAGGSTIILTLTGDTWVASGATFDAQRQNIINGLDSAQSEANGWDAVVKATAAVTDVVRTSDTVVTITLEAFPGYNISSNETITATIPASALSGGVSLVASPSFSITANASAGRLVLLGAGL